MISSASKGNGWPNQRLDRVLIYRKRQATPGELRGKRVFHYSIPIIAATGDGQFEDGEEIDSNKFIVTGDEILVSKLNPHKGHLIMTRPQQSLAVCSTEFLPLVPREGERRFFYYLYASQPVRQQIVARCQSATRSHMRALPEDIWKLTAAIPPPPNQRTIANFLDRKTAAIDELIRKKERLIELLQEKRQALITQAVTKGLDPNVPMKDSGVPWLGEIPAHWEVKRLRHAVRVANQNRLPINRAERAEIQGVYPYWGPTGVLDHIDEYRFEGAYALIGEDGDHFTKYATWEMTQWATGQFNVNNHAHVIASGATCSARWFYWSFRHRDIGADLIAQGVSRLKLTRWALSNLWLPLPPAFEQAAICGFLDGAETGHEKTVAAIVKAVSALREYRQALISAAVTGQIDVNGASV